MTVNILSPRDQLAVAIAVYASTWPRPVDLADALLPVVDDIYRQRLQRLMPKPGEFTGNCCEHCAAIEDDLEALR